MRALTAPIVAILLSATMLSGCSAYGDYCDEVENAQPELLDFGAKSTKAFTRYSELTQKIAAVAPEDVAKYWKEISVATGAVADAQRAAHIDLSDMGDSAKVGSLTRKQIKDLNQAYLDFNDTQQARKVVVADVVERCNIDLAKEKK